MGAKAIPALKGAADKSGCRRTLMPALFRIIPVTPSHGRAFAVPARKGTISRLLRTTSEYAGSLLEEVRPSIISSSAKRH